MTSCHARSKMRLKNIIIHSRFFPTLLLCLIAFIFYCVGWAGLRGDLENSGVNSIRKVEIRKKPRADCETADTFIVDSVVCHHQHHRLHRQRRRRQNHTRELGSQSFVTSQTAGSSDRSAPARQQEQQGWQSGHRRQRRGRATGKAADRYGHYFTSRRSHADNNDEEDEDGCNDDHEDALRQMKFSREQTRKGFERNASDVIVFHGFRSGNKEGGKGGSAFHGGVGDRENMSMMAASVMRFVSAGENNGSIPLNDRSTGVVNEGRREKSRLAARDEGRKLPGNRCINTLLDGGDGKGNRGNTERVRGCGRGGAVLRGRRDEGGDIAEHEEVRTGERRSEKVVEETTGRPGIRTIGSGLGTGAVGGTIGFEKDVNAMSDKAETISPIGHVSSRLNPNTMTSAAVDTIAPSRHTITPATVLYDQRVGLSTQVQPKRRCYSSKATTLGTWMEISADKQTDSMNEGLIVKRDSYGERQRYTWSEIREDAQSERGTENIADTSRDSSSDRQTLMILDNDANESVTSAMPKIIHQTSDNLLVPAQVIEWMKSWRRHNDADDYEHWFWSDSGIRRVLRQHYPVWLRDLYDNYPHDINRADVRKYIIIYLYGGVYADLDTECLRPISKLLQERSDGCILGQEPELHRVFLYGRKPRDVYLTTSFIACRPRHPFMRRVLEALPLYASNAATGNWNDNILNSTGPTFFTEVAERYIQSLNMKSSTDSINNQQLDNNDVIERKERATKLARAATTFQVKLNMFNSSWNSSDDNYSGNNTSSDNKNRKNKKNRRENISISNSDASDSNNNKSNNYSNNRSIKKNCKNGIDSMSKHGITSRTIRSSVINSNNSGNSINNQDQGNKMRIFIALSEWFVPTFDEINLTRFKVQCRTNLSSSTLPSACKNVMDLQRNNKPSSVSYTVHHWLHSWASNFIAKNKVPVNTILQFANIVS